MNKTMKKTPKISQADQLMERWAGRTVRGDRIAGAIPEMTGFKARRILAVSEPYKSNPEYAIGCARLLMTYNIMTAKDLSWMLRNHPAWSQIMGQNLDPNGVLMTTAQNSDWGKTHKVTATLEMSGTAEISYEGFSGVKTEKVKLGFEMIRYEGDTRPFIALNLGGGSAIRSHLLKLPGASRPDYKVNDDSNTRRRIKTRRDIKAEEAQLAIAEEAMEQSVDDTFTRLLAGEEVTMGLGAFDAPVEPVPKKKFQSIGKNINKVNVGAYRKR